MDMGVGLEEEVEQSWSLLSWGASCVMVFGGVVPYVPQYQEILRTSNTEGFSTRVCLVLLLANILRIFFWIGRQFELTLLIQSVVMILTMLAMLHLCCSIQSTNRVSTRQHHITDLDVRYFWRWSRFEDYLIFCFAFTVMSAFVTFLSSTRSCLWRRWARWRLCSRPCWACRSCCRTSRTALPGA
ncbi:hypothetical protein COCON_G00107970 [Conger conger]|uniref:Uncharacterized protein n=1 Tax=Conger conger TaxID=82655 RepID=A0A9Q1DJC2_CONCO|nr:hypothetical protein COCON_G00107970 [Conger conger]